ncbi:MAG: S41 family peptidase [Ostreibacterium sp.]
MAIPVTIRAKTSAALPLDEIRNFVDVYNVIKNEYVEEKDGKTLIDFAIEGMLKSLDPHSVYFKHKQLENFQENTNGSYNGFGFQLDIIKDHLIIVSPIAGSPAEKAGLKPNDNIIKINNIVIENMSMQDVSNLLKAKKTTILTITSSNGKTREVTLTRSSVTLPSISSKILDHNYGYIRISQFQQNTATQFNTALKKQLNDNIKGLIIDLRNNPGGLVHVATSIADDFLEAGLIVSTKNTNTGSEDKIHANKNSTIAKDLSLVILINNGSASASELLAGALQSHKRAVIVGQVSFGKGSVQNIITLSNGDAIKLTTALYYTPNGQSIQAKGITPDITLSQLQVSDKTQNLFSYSEANIAGHLRASETHKNKKVLNKKQSTKKSDSQTNTDKNHNKTEALSGSILAKSDLQLFEALNVLKALTLDKH